MTQVNNAGGLVPEVTLGMDYDFEGNRTGIQDSLGGSVSYAWQNQRLESMVMNTAESKTAQVDLSYDSVGRLTSLKRTANGDPSTTINTNFTLDLLDRVTSITHQKVMGEVATSLSAFSYSFDTNGRVASYSGPEGSLSFALDTNGQLLSVTGARTENYQYDPMGNRGTTITAPGNLLLNDGKYSYTYDLEGNQKTRTRLSDGQLTEYFWDHRNQLTKALVKDANGVLLKELRFTYDVEGRRVGVWVDADGAGPADPDQVWTVYDGANPYIDFDGEGQLQARYLYGPGIDELFARIGTGEDPEWFLTDRLGSVRQIVDASGAVLDDIGYDSFGGILNETNPAQGDRFKFTGREYSPELGIYYYRARWYDPAAGRFISQDPIGFSAGDPNLYRYVGNAPGDGTDPSGLQTTFFESMLIKRYESQLKENKNPSNPEPWEIPYKNNPSAQADFDKLRAFVLSQTYSVSWVDPCFDWGRKVDQALPIDFCNGKRQIKVRTVFFDIKGSWFINGHQAFEVKFPDGQIIYFDEGGPWSSRAGALGGKDRWFLPDEIPVNYILVPRFETFGK